MAAALLCAEGRSCQPRVKTGGNVMVLEIGLCVRIIASLLQPLLLAL